MYYIPSTVRLRKFKAKGCPLKQFYVALHYTNIKRGCDKKIFSNDDIKVDCNNCTAKEASLALHYFSGIQKSAKSHSSNSELGERLLKAQADQMSMIKSNLWPAVACGQCCGVVVVVELRTDELLDILRFGVG